MKKLPIKIPKPNKKFLFIIVIIILLAASQWWSIRMVYSQQFKGQTAFWLAKLYHLSAGQVEKDNKKISIALTDYLANQDLGERYIAKKLASGSNQDTVLSAENISDSTWQKVLQEAWIKEIAQKYDIKVSNEDTEEYLKGIDDIENLKKTINADFGVSFETYQNLVIKPLILQAKVYQYFLENFNDMEGMKNAQAAYDALVKEKRDFKEVAKQYSDDLQYVDSSLFLKDSQLGSFGDPIRNLEPGGYSKIVILPGDPGAYVIWRLESRASDPTSQENVFELRGIAIAAKSMGQFLNDYLSGAQINRLYK